MTQASNVGRRADIVVIGAGIVGLSVAHALLEHRPDLELVVVDKEDRVATHQSGRNSGVIHSGVYYRPETMKARLAMTGRALLIDFCREAEIPCEITGKVIVACDDRELRLLDELRRRGTSNGVHLDSIGPDRLRELEPHATGVAALHVHDAGVVDFSRVAAALADRLVDRGADLRLGWRVVEVRETGRDVTVGSDGGDLSAALVVNAAGLFADTLTPFHDRRHADVRIVPFRGEYYGLVADRAHLVRALIYPVADPELPFLGVHLSRGIGGDVHVGPNAILALSREGYSWGDVDRREVLDMFRFPGFRRLARRYWRVGVTEVSRSLSRTAVARTLRRIVPEIRAADLAGRSSGVRAQAVDAQGRLVDDFVFRDSARTINVVSAPSPGATASLAIGREIAARALGRLDEHAT